MSQPRSDVLNNIYHFILIDIIPILLIFLNHYIYKKMFLIDSHVKTSGRIYWYARFWQKLLNLLQGVPVDMTRSVSDLGRWRPKRFSILCSFFGLAPPPTGNPGSARGDANLHQLVMWQSHRLVLISGADPRGPGVPGPLNPRFWGPKIESYLIFP